MGAKPEVKICSRCVLPEAFPGIRMDKHGLCNICRDAPIGDKVAEHMTVLRGAMKEVILVASNSGAAYDCIVAFSGGKDSTYTLKLLTERYGLHCLAVMVDNGFVSAGAMINARVVTDALGVDMQVFRPAPNFMNTLYRTSATSTGLHANAAVKRASNMCSSCISLINNYMLKLAAQTNVPLIAGGYIGGQVPKDAAILSVDLGVFASMREASLKRFVEHIGPEAHKYFDLPHSKGTGSNRIITIINPMLTELVSEEEIVTEIGKLGWKRTTDTGPNSSNCMINDLGVAVHYSQYGFNPYIMEIAEQVRNGKMTREQGIERAFSIPERSAVEPLAAKIGLILQQID